jgi:predicted nuclease with RNAse H fold
VRHYYLGVDIAGEANTWVAALIPSDGDLEIALAPRAMNSQELLDLVAREEPTAVAIDGQLSLAFSEANGFRSGDFELRALLPPDCRTWVASANSLMCVPVRARLLADALSPLVGTILETHPRANLYLELGAESLADIKEYKRSSDACRRLTSRWCESNRIRRPEEFDCDGALDAVVCATLAHSFHHAPHRLRLLQHTAADRQGRGPFVVFDSRRGVTR